MKHSRRRKSYAIPSEAIGTAAMVMLALGMVFATIQLLVEAHFATSSHDRVANSFAAGYCAFVASIASYCAWRIVHGMRSKKL